MTRERDNIELGVTISENSDGSVTANEPLKLLIGSTKTSGSSAYTAPVMSGQTVTRQFSVPVYPNQGSDTETVRVNWGRGSISKEVSIND